MKKLFLSILAIVCLLATLTVLNAVPVSAGTLTITPPVGGPEESPSGKVEKPGEAEPPARVIMVDIPEGAGEDLSEVAERNPILQYLIDPMPPPGPQL